MLAATAVDSRPLAARPLARAALSASAGRRGGPTTALALLRHRATARVRALQDARPRSRWSAALPAVALTAGTGLALADAAAALDRFLEILHP